MDIELKPCPFCGNDGVWVQSLRYPLSLNRPYLVHSIMCSNEQCIMHQTEKFFMTEKAAKIAWNQRVE